MDRKTEEDEKFDSMVYGIQKTSEGVPRETVTVSPLLEGEEPLRLEKDTTHRNTLMMSTEYSDDNNTAASASDAEKANDNKEVQKNAKEAVKVEKNSSSDAKAVDKSDGDKDEESTEESTEISTVPLNGRKVYLTFDGGPDENTNEILDVLAKKLN